MSYFLSLSLLIQLQKNEIQSLYALFIAIDSIEIPYFCITVFVLQLQKNVTRRLYNMWYYEDFITLYSLYIARKDV